MTGTFLILNLLLVSSAVAAASVVDNNQHPTILERNAEDGAFWRQLVNEFASVPPVPSTSPTPQPSIFTESPASAVRCQNPFALCAFANCTVNSDGLTADCGCYSFPDAASISVSRTALIPNVNGLRDETISACNTTDSCFEAQDQIDQAPVCQAIEDGSMWPGASMVSTFAPLLEEENGVMKDPEGNNLPTWMCPAAPGRRVPICMLAPCVAATTTLTNPYNFDNGRLDQICTCPLVEVTEPYPVFGGLQDPCSTTPTMPGDFVQAAAGPLLFQLESDPTRVDEGWGDVTAVFETKV